MPWDAFCEEHYKQAMKDIAKRHKDHDVGFTEYVVEEGEEPIICGYNDCPNPATIEVIWIEKAAWSDETSVEYTGLEGLK